MLARAITYAKEHCQPPEIIYLNLGGNKFGAEGCTELRAFRDRHEGQIDVSFDTETEENSADGSDGDAKLPDPPKRLPNPAEEAAAAAAVGGEGSSPNVQQGGWIGKAPPSPASAIPAGQEKKPFALGSTVVVTGLTKAKQYNDQQGIVTSGVLNGRITVWMEKARKAIAIKPENLTLKAPAPDWVTALGE